MWFFVIAFIVAWGLQLRKIQETVFLWRQDRGIVVEGKKGGERINRPSSTNTALDFGRFHQVAAVPKHIDLSEIGLIRQSHDVYYGMYQGVAVWLTPVRRNGQSYARLSVKLQGVSKLVFGMQMGKAPDTGITVVRTERLEHGRFGLLRIESNDLDRMERILKRPKVEVYLCKIEQLCGALRVDTVGGRLVAEFDMAALERVAAVDGLLRFLLLVSEEIRWSG